MAAQPGPADPPSLTPEQAVQPLTVGMLPSVLAGLAPAIRDYLEEALTPLVARVQALEARPVLRYVGVYEAGREYTPGEVATDHGGLWHCGRSTKTRPGTTDAWTMCCKAGRDGRDAR